METSPEARLLQIISEFINVGYRYLQGRGWYRYEDGILPPDPSNYGPDSALDQRFRRALSSFEDIRFDMTNTTEDLPF